MERPTILDTKPRSTGSAFPICRRRFCTHLDSTISASLIHTADGMKLRPRRRLRGPRWFTSCSRTQLSDMWSASLLMFVAGCATLSAAEPSTRFERDILPIFTANCFNCHSGGSLIGLDLRTAESTLQGSHQGPVVVKGSPEKSPLYQKVSSRAMPPPAFKLKLTDAQIETIKKWIEDGAPHEETKNGNLQAEMVRFDKEIKPLLAARCPACHAPAHPMAGLHFPPRP